MTARGIVPVMLVAALFVIAAGSLCVGNLMLTPALVARALFEAGGDPFTLIVRELRLPRFVAALLVGASLAVAGALMQGITRNPLADPTLTGVVSGGALAVVAVTLLVPAIPAVWHPLVALAGGVASATLTFTLAWRGRLAPLHLALGGITVGALGSAGIITLMVVAGPQAGPLFYWLAGGLAGVGWRQVWNVTPWIMAGLASALAGARILDTLALDDATAQSVGLGLRGARLAFGGVSIILSGAVVAIAGPVGFVGLCGPHLARLVAGPGHRSSLPLAALIGAVLVSGADLLARTIAAPRELPVGFLTALFGTPLLIILIRRGAGAPT